MPADVAIIDAHVARDFCPTTGEVNNVIQRNSDVNRMRKNAAIVVA